MCFENRCPSQRKSIGFASGEIVQDLAISGYLIFRLIGVNH
jgi:hypothetical protein